MNTREFRAAIPPVRPIYLKLLGWAFGLGVAYKALTGEVDDLKRDKVNNTDFAKHVTNEDSLKSEILRKLEKFDNKLDDFSKEQHAQHNYLCQDHPRDIGCQK